MDTNGVKGLLALLLADGSLTRYRSINGGYVQMVLTAGLLDRDFLEDRANAVRRFIPTKAQVVPYKTAARENGKRTEMLRFRVSSKGIIPIYHLLYPMREKTISSETLSLVGLQGAAWMWAEGVRLQKDGSAYMVRVGRSEHEGFLVAGWLNTLLGIQPELLDNRPLPRLRLSAEDVKRTQDLLRSCAPPSRIHLFEHHECPIHYASSSLLPRPWAARRPGQSAEALAAAEKTGNGEDLRGSPDAAAKEIAPCAMAH